VGSSHSGAHTLSVCDARSATQAQWLLPPGVDGWAGSSVSRPHECFYYFSPSAGMSRREVRTKIALGVFAVVLISIIIGLIVWIVKSKQSDAPAAAPAAGGGGRLLRG